MSSQRESHCLNPIGASREPPIKVKTLRVDRTAHRSPPDPAPWAEARRRPSHRRRFERPDLVAGASELLDVLVAPRLHRPALPDSAGASPSGPERVWLLEIGRAH